jgi:hypothetical protein
MLTIRRATDRMHTQIGWLDSRHTFSFAALIDEGAVEPDATGPAEVLLIDLA